MYWNNLNYNNLFAKVYINKIIEIYKEIQSDFLIYQEFSIISKSVPNYWDFLALNYYTIYNLKI